MAPERLPCLAKGRSCKGSRVNRVYEPGRARAGAFREAKGQARGQQAVAEFLPPPSCRDPRLLSPPRGKRPGAPGSLPRSPPDSGPEQAAQAGCKQEGRGGGRVRPRPPPTGLGSPGPGRPPPAPASVSPPSPGSPQRREGRETAARPAPRCLLRAPAPADNRRDRERRRPGTGSPAPPLPCLSFPTCTIGLTAPPPRLTKPWRAPSPGADAGRVRRRGRRGRPRPCKAGLQATPTARQYFAIDRPRPQPGARAQPAWAPPRKRPGPRSSPRRTHSLRSPGAGSPGRTPRACIACAAPPGPPRWGRGAIATPRRRSAPLAPGAATPSLPGTPAPPCTLPPQLPHLCIAAPQLARLLSRLRPGGGTKAWAGARCLQVGDRERKSCLAANQGLCVG